MTYTPTTAPTTYVNAWAYTTAPGAKSCELCATLAAMGIFYLPIDQPSPQRPPLHRNCTCTLYFVGTVIAPKGFA